MSSVKYINHGVLIVLFSTALLVSCSAAEPMPPTETPTVTWTPLPTHTATPTATPTPTTNLFLDAAEQAEFNGDWDRALAGYEQAVAFALDPEEIVRAELGRGRTLIAHFSQSALSWHWIWVRECLRHTYSERRHRSN
jgi:hypothetical protein